MSSKTPSVTEYMTAQQSQFEQACYEAWHGERKVMKPWAAASSGVKEDLAARDAFNGWKVAVSWYEEEEKKRQKEAMIAWARDRAVAAPLAPITTYTVAKRVGEAVKVHFGSVPQVVIQLENDSVAIEVAEAALKDE